MIVLDTIYTRQRDIAKKRMEICNECEHLMPIIRTCKKCGCFVDAKTKLMSSSCPINKWSSEKEG